ncbi:MAG TPA: tetratricopeptide repeat protein [Bdellovibrionales bacterium]|jgi:tetratricopeptide (TPR) repeat protein|nr:tetratricopeptide repeat protein [Bdellovibrionales bacterium]
MAGSEIIREHAPRQNRIVEEIKVSDDVSAGRALPSERAAQAIAEFDRDPTLAMLMKNARILIKNGESRLAFNILRDVLLRAPDHPEALGEMATCLRDDGRFEEALKCYRALAKITPSLEADVAIAETLYLSERDDMALAAYREILKLVVADRSVLFEIYKNVGNIHVRAGEFDAAEEFYDKAYTIQPDSDILLVNYGTLEIQRENHESAVERFRAAVAINSNNDKAWVGLALVHRAMGDLELAKANLARALDISSNNRTAIRLSVEWSVQDGDAASAIRRLEKYVSEAGSEDVDLCFVFSKLLIQVGRLSEARIELERVLALDPTVEGGIALARVLDKARSVPA